MNASIFENKILKLLREEKECRLSGGLYHELQVRLHAEFEYIHPFQDGNGRVGRLVAFKECLRHNIIPFIIEDRKKNFYYRGLAEWRNEKGFLTDTCLDGRDTRTFRSIQNTDSATTGTAEEAPDGRRRRAWPLAKSRTRCSSRFWATSR